MGAIETELNRVNQSSYSSKRQSVPIPASFASVEQAGPLSAPKPPPTLPLLSLRQLHSLAGHL